MKRAWATGCALLAALLLPALALAAKGTAQENSMVVTGTITVDPAGRVAGYALREPDKLPPVVRQIIQQTVPTWTFVPILDDGRPVAAKTGMSLRVVATITDAEHATIRVASAAFGCEARQKSRLPGECPAGTAVAYKHRERPPSYPTAALRAGLGGEVYLVLAIGRDGHVVNAAVRQVNLYSRISDAHFYRQAFANTALEAARKWTFDIPTTGPKAAKEHWVIQVPVNYSIGHASGVKYGQWNAYVPGPVQNVPWSDDDASGAARGADAIAGSAPFVRDPRFVLKTPLVAGAGQS